MKWTRKKSCFFYTKGLVVFCCWAAMLFPFESKAQSEEILLTFKYPAVGHFYVNSIHNTSTGTNFLPLIELFHAFEIFFNSIDRNIVQGKFITADKPFTINLVSRTIVLGTTLVNLSQDDFILSETDLFLSPAVFQEVFGLYFTVNLHHLALNLTTSHILPVQERVSRELLRSRITTQQNIKEDFPLRFPLKRSIISGAMLDYGLGLTLTEYDRSLDFTLVGGMELLGGDLQGSGLGFADDAGNYSFTTTNLRWRYAVRNNPVFSNFTAGQLSTTGVLSQAITGFSISNEPIEPRKMHESYVFDGTTEPDSEVELFVNDQIVAYMRADEFGYYRFEVPLMYGNTRISIRIFTPQGELKVLEHNIPIPFTFLPPGVVTYNLQGGRLNADPNIRDARLGVAHGNIALGVNRWLTAQIGAHAFGGKGFNFENKVPYGVLSARIAHQYLVSIEAVANAFYRLNTTFLSPKNFGFHLQYTHFDGPGIFNPLNADGEVSASMSFPFNLFGIDAGLRIGGEGIQLGELFSLRYRADFHARLGRVNLRINYRDNLANSMGVTTMGTGIITKALTYNIRSTPGLPVFARGMFLRAQGSYDIRRNLLVLSDMQISRTITRTGRLNLGVGFNHETNQLDFRLGFTLDLSTVRSTSTLLVNNTGDTYTQTLTGSIGIDASNRFVQLSNRQQVGYGALSVIQFVDYNGSGTYDKGERLLPYRGVNLDRTGNMSIGRDSILRITQLQSYHLYNLTVNRYAISDPTLVPNITEFSFVVDPNQYKQIEIPYNQGGTISGTVGLLRNGESQGLGGLRLVLESTTSDFRYVLRTFSDGSFYIMDLPPGMFTLQADSLQLGFLGAEQKEPLLFEIKSTPDGNFVDGLDIIVHSTLPTMAGLPITQQQTEPQVHYIDEPTMKDDHIQVLHDRVFIAGIQQQNQEIVVQAGAFRLRSHAVRLQARIETLTDLPVFVLLENGISRIIIFGFESVEHALQLQRILTEQEIPSFLRLSTNNLPRVQLPAQEITVPASRADTLVGARDRIQITNFTGRIEDILLQAGAFSILANAEKFHAHIETLIDISVSTQKEDSLSKVLIYGFESVDHALRIQNVLTQNGIPSFFRLATNQHLPNRQLQLHEIAVQQQYTEIEVDAPIIINIANLTHRIQEVVMQVGAFVNRTNAEKLQTRIQQLTGQPISILLDNTLHKVLISGFESVDQAINVQNLLTQQGISSFFTLSSEFNLP